jgi:DNA-binding NarL/FixJ family response regulator
MGTQAVALLADDPGAGRQVAELLARAGVAVERWAHGTATVLPQRDHGRVLVALLAGDAATRAESLPDVVERFGDMPVVVTMPADAPNGLLRRVLHAGAHGIVLDEELERSLLPSIEAVAAGQLAVPSRLRRQLAPRHLTYREKQILGLVVIGYTNRQIADELVLAESTIKTHLSSAFAKLEARSRAEAAALILDPDEPYHLGMAPVLAEVVAPAA